MSRELFDEIGDRVTKEDWEKFDMLQGDFLGDGKTMTRHHHPPTHPPTARPSVLLAGWLACLLRAAMRGRAG